MIVEKNMISMSFRFSSILIFLTNLFFERIVKRDKASDTMCKRFDLILIRIDRADKNWNVRINLRFSLSMLTVIKNVWNIKLIVTEWSIKITINDFLQNSIKCQSFLIIQIISVISNFVNQYFVFVFDNCLFTNKIGWIFILLMFLFWHDSRLKRTWKIISSKFFFWRRSRSRKRIFLNWNESRNLNDWTFFESVHTRNVFFFVIFVKNVCLKKFFFDFSFLGYFWGVKFCVFEMIQSFEHNTEHNCEINRSNRDTFSAFSKCLKTLIC